MMCPWSLPEHPRWVKNKYLLDGRMAVQGESSGLTDFLYFSLPVS